MWTTRGARSNDNNPGVARPVFEPADHAVGRSRGGLSTKVHLLVDDAGRPLVVLVSPGQAGDNPALQPMLDELRIARRGPGRPRSRPVLVRADKAYSARAPAATYAAAASRPSSPSRTTRPATASAAARAAAGP